MKDNNITVKNSLLDVSFGFPYGFGILTRKKNKNILKALLGFERNESGFFIFLFFKSFKI